MLLNATISGWLTWGEIGLGAQWDNGTSWQIGMDWHGVKWDSVHHGTMGHRGKLAWIGMG